MTSRQITKNLTAANINLDHLTINRNEIQVYVTDVDGDRDWDATEELANQVMKTLGWGGMRASGGHWIIQPNVRIDEFAGSLYGRENY